MNDRPLLITTEQKPSLPILIVDKNGLIGKGLTRILRGQYLVVIVTADEVENHDNVIHIPYRKKIPVIPDNIYSHMFLVYNGEKEILDMLSSFIDKAQESKTKLFFISSIAYSSEQLFYRLRQKLSPNLYMVMYGQTFADRHTEANEINTMIRQSRLFGRIEIPNTGLGLVHPILFEDVIESIITVAFSFERHAHLLYAFSPHPVTQIAVARILQQQNPLLKIDYKKRATKSQSFYVPSGGTYLIDHYDLSEKFKKLDITPVKNIDKMSLKKEKSMHKDPEVKKRRILIFYTLLFSLFIAPLIVTFLLAVIGTGFLTLSFKQAEAGKIIVAQRTGMVSEYAFTATEALVPSLVLPSVFFPEQTDGFLENIKTANEVVGIELDGLYSFQILQNIYNKKSLDPKNDFLHALATLKNTLLTFQKLKAENKLPQVVDQKMQKYAGILQVVEGTIDTWPALFGFEDKKKYMVLFQNNMELRPGGGFIGSYGLIPIQNGQLEKLQIYDVYDADGKLTTAVDAPYGLRRYLGASHWFLRDSNFDADFINNATQANKFLQLETNTTVDGVIAIDTTFLKYLLSVLGSVTLNDYKETVTADNFYLKTQSHVESGFFPGSTQKKDFLRSLTNAMSQQFMEGKHVSYDKLLQVVDTAIKEKHLMFAFTDPGIQNVFTVNGLSSSLSEQRIRDKNSFLDFFSVFDANVGANKTNYYIKRSISQDIRFDSAGGLQATAEVNYINTSTDISPFGGDYKNYVRFILPIDVTLQHIFIDNQEQQITDAITDPAIYTSTAFQPPSGLEVEQVESKGKKEIGFFFIVPKGSSKKVTITYHVSKAVSLDDQAFSYKLQLFKQPGTENDPYALTFTYPNTFKIIKTEKGIVDLGGKFTLETTLGADKNIFVALAQK